MVGIPTRTARIPTAVLVDIVHPLFMMTAENTQIRYRIQLSTVSPVAGPVGQAFTDRRMDPVPMQADSKDRRMDPGGNDK